jgi:2'-5' RNA ligase
MNQPYSARETINRMRVFIGLKLPDEVTTAIQRIQEKLAGHRFKVRWVKAESIHLTLKFLGDVDGHLIDDVAASVTDAVDGMPPFQLYAKGIGVFPSIKRARVIWLGISGQVPALTELQKTIEINLARLGFPHDRRPFSGHLTLGRTKGAIEAVTLRKAIDEFRTFESESFIVEKVTVFRSEVKPTGAVYTELREISLVSN